MQCGSAMKWTKQSKNATVILQRPISSQQLLKWHFTFFVTTQYESTIAQAKEKTETNNMHELSNTGNQVYKRWMNTQVAVGQGTFGKKYKKIEEVPTQHRYMQIKDFQCGSINGP